MRRIALSLVLLVAACARKLDGPAPAVTGLAPRVVCNAQLTTAVAVSGSGFSPTAEGAAVRERLRLPAVTLTPRATLAGDPLAGAAVAIPDDPAAPAGSHVGWSSQAAMRFDVFPALALPDAILDVTVRNPDGHAATREGALAAVPPPRLDRVAPAAVCVAATALPVVLTGAGFLVLDGVGPTVTIGSQSYQAVASQCVAVPGFPGVERCTQLTVTVDGTAFTLGEAYPVTVVNPPPAACSSAAASLTITAPPTLAQVAPITLCATGGGLTLTGTGFQDGASVTIDGAAPGGGAATATSVTVGSATTAGATFQPAPAEAMVPSPTPYPITIHNPDGCAATLPAAVTVKPAPALFFVDPPVVYSGIVTQATIYATGIALPLQSVTLAPSAGGAPIPFAACTGGGGPPCFTTDPVHPNNVQILVPAGLAAGSYDVTVVDSTSGCAEARLPAGLRVTDQITLALAAPPLAPAFGWTGGTTAVTASAGTGASFLPGARVYLNPVNASATTVASALGAVAAIDAGQLSALVPAGLPVGGYDLVVVNPDGAVGVSAAAFRVTALPPPTITTVSPGQLPTNAAQATAIVGRHFRAPAVSFACFDQGGAPIGGTPTFTGATLACDAAEACTLSGSLSFSSAAACVVRVTNGDDGTFGEFSSVAFTAPSGNLAGAITRAVATDPTTAFRLAGGGRRAPVLLGGDATSAARFLHVIGGDPGTGAALGTVESATLAPDGRPGRFATQRTRLAQPRTYAAGALVSFAGSRRYLYVAGGSSAAGGVTTRLASVERAAVLDPLERGVVTDLLLEVNRAGGMGPGLWYYRVAAVLGPDHPVNPDGENLPSDPFPVKLPDLDGPGIDVTVAWAAVPGAARYRVYRSATPADAPGGPKVGEEVVIAEVDAPATTFKDAGAAALPGVTDRPLPVGSLGAWKEVAQLSVAREGPGVAFLADPVTPTAGYLYVLGGRSSAGTALASTELIPITLDPATGHQAVGAPVAGLNPLPSARWRFGAVTATSTVSTRILPGRPFVYALAGQAAGGAAVNDVAAATVGAGGQLVGPAPTGPWYDVGAANQLAPGAAGIMAGYRLFGFGGFTGAATAGIPSAIVCGPGQSGCNSNAPPDAPPFVVNWNAGQTLSTARADPGGTLSGAFIYLVGGTGVSGAALDSLEYFVW